MPTLLAAQDQGSTPCKMLLCVAMHRHSPCKCKRAHGQAPLFACLYQTVSNVHAKTLYEALLWLQHMTHSHKTKMDMGRKANLLWTTPTAGWPGMCHCRGKADKGAVKKVPPTRALIWQESCSTNCTSLKTSQVRGKRPIWSRLKILLLGEWGVQTRASQASQVASSWIVMLSSHCAWSEPDPVFLWLTKFPFHSCSGRQAKAILTHTHTHTTPLSLPLWIKSN